MKLAILMSGDCRTNPIGIKTGYGKNRAIHREMLNLFSILKKNGFDVNLFLCVDDLNRDVLADYGNITKNYYLTDNGKFLDRPSSLENFNSKIYARQYFEKFANLAPYTVALIKEKYPQYRLSMNEDKLSSKDFNNPSGWDRHIYQYCKLYGAFVLMEDYEEKTGKTYDFVMRIRPDIIIDIGIKRILSQLEEIRREETIASYTDLFMFGNRDLMSKICSFVKDYGSYYELMESRFKAGHNLEWAFIPEMQLYSYVYKITGMDLDIEIHKFEIVLKIIRY
jgi:hypothetical protein